MPNRAAAIPTTADSNKYGNVDAKLRLYPQERALEGLGLAASLGLGFVTPRSRTQCDFLGENCTNTPSERTVTPSFAIEAHYQFLLGSNKRTAVGAGFGAKRYFASQTDLGGDSQVRPTGRLTIGYAF